MKLIEISASAGISGFESPAAEYRELPLSLDELLINHPSSTFLAKANGHSMQGVGIFDGDILIVDRAVTPKHLDVVVAIYNAEFVCKVLDSKLRVLRSANHRVADVGITEFDGFSVEGVVVRSIRCHQPTFMHR